MHCATCSTRACAAARVSRPPVPAPRVVQAGKALGRRLAPVGCGVLLLLAAWPARADEVTVRVRHALLHAGASCTGQFARHALPHTTRAADRPARSYDSYGAGVALADLDGDGLIDIALAGLRAPVTLLWNRGGLRFERVELAEAATRAVVAVDIDGNGNLDLAFSRAGSGPALWRGNGRARRFERPHALWLAPLPIYAMAWADLDGDLDLDLVGATYNDELWLAPAAGQADSGVFYYENTGRALLPLRLTRNAQALAVLLTDLNRDGRADILVGNDFALRDAVYYHTPDGWQAADPFARTTRNTMSFATGDVDNDGRLELLATDMKPYLTGPAIDAAWRPVRVAEALRLDKLAAVTGQELSPDPRQVEANTLQMRGPDDTFVDRAEWAGVTATGWTWSAQFGDLDNDGFLDLYLVNGMIAQEIFGHLPGAELVEENQALRNDGSGRFVPVPEWGLGATESGRGMAFADLDLDGDLDIVANNLEAPALLFENRICGGSGLEVDLRWPASPNPRAIGATVRLVSATATYLRTVQAGSGYLSSDPARLHFGLPSGAGELALTVTWPDGAVSRAADVRPGTLVTIQR